MPDKYGYPTPEELRKIKEWNCIDDLDGLLRFVENLWYYPDRFYLTGKKVKRLYLSTGGWSGNESVIKALRETMFWCFAWWKSQRGGHYWFKWKTP